MTTIKKAIVLLSGGLDSATVLWLAKKRHKPFCLIFNYNQRHKKEIESAKKIALKAGCDCKVIKLELPEGTCSLTNMKMSLPASHSTQLIGEKIPSTYVPARNLIFLSLAVSYAESTGAEAVFIGANAVDFSGYPDCTPDFFKAFRQTIKKGTKSGKKTPVKIMVPLLNKSKDEIIKTGLKLKVPYELTWSCYQGGSSPCGKCDSCLLRKEGFRKAGIIDPA